MLSNAKLCEPCKIIWRYGERRYYAVVGLWGFGVLTFWRYGKRRYFQVNYVNQVKPADE